MKILLVEDEEDIASLIKLQAELAKQEAQTKKAETKLQRIIKFGFFCS